MTFKGHTGVGFGHAGTVIHHLYQVSAGLAYNKFNLGSAGINGVFQQLLYNGGRSLYHFTRRNLVGYVIR